MPLTAAVQKEVGNLDKTYGRIIGELVNHVDKTEGLKPDSKGHYATPENIRSFFSNVVASKMTINRAGAAKRCPALQALIAAEHGDSKSFKIRDDIDVQRALSLHDREWKKMNREKAGESDPHDNLQHNVPSYQDIDTILKECENRGPSGTQLAVSFLGGIITFARGQTQRAFLVGDLGVEDKSFGPPMADDHLKRYPMMYLCIGKGVGKDAQSVTRVTGAWRHLRVRECLTGWIALHLFNQLTIQQKPLDFSSSDSPNSIRKMGLLLSWEDTTSGSGSHREAMKALFQKCGLTFSKVTHGRMFGIQLSGAQGATPEDVAGLSKHQTGKLHKTYWLDLPPRVLAMLAGVIGDFWGYHVPRWFISLFPEIVDLLFPAHKTWVEQIKNGGDTGTRATIFVNKVVPFMANILWQDAVWCRNTPGLTDNIRVQWVRSKVKNFDHLAVKAYQEMLEKEKTIVAKAGAAASSSQSSNIMAAHVSGLKGQIEEVQSQVKSQEVLLSNLVQAVTAQTMLLQQVLRNVSPVHGTSSSAAAAATAPGAAAVAPAISKSATPQGLPSPPSLTHCLKTPAVPATASAAAPRMPTFLPAAQGPLNTGPVIPKKLPETVHQLIEQHLNGNWAAYADAKDKADWEPKGKRMAYSKRQYLYMKIKTEVEIAPTSRFPAGASFRDKMLSVAAHHDSKRGSAVSVPTYILQLKQDDPRSQTRKKRKPSKEASAGAGLLDLAQFGAAGTAK